MRLYVLLTQVSAEERARRLGNVARILIDLARHSQIEQDTSDDATAVTTSARPPERNLGETVPPVQSSQFGGVQ